MKIEYFIKSSEPIFNALEQLEGFNIVYTGQRLDNYKQYSITFSFQLEASIDKPWLVTFDELSSLVDIIVDENNYKLKIEQSLKND